MIFARASERLSRDDVWPIRRADGRTWAEHYATLAEMNEWAADVMRREPDVVIGEDYMRRWWVIPRNEACNVYLHQIVHSDDDRALHDHPWENTSYLLSGGYIEHTPRGSFRRAAGDVVTRPAKALHRLELIDGAPAVSLFMTGPKVREWGFQTVCGWRAWWECVNADNPRLPDMPTRVEDC